MATVVLAAVGTGVGVGPGVGVAGGELLPELQAERANKNENTTHIKIAGVALVRSFRLTIKSPFY